MGELGTFLGRLVGQIRVLPRLSRLGRDVRDLATLEAYYNLSVEAFQNERSKESEKLFASLHSALTPCGPVICSAFWPVNCDQR